MFFTGKQKKGKRMSARTQQKVGFEEQVRKLNLAERGRLIGVIAGVTIKELAQKTLINFLEHLPEDPARPRHTDAS